MTNRLPLIAIAGNANCPENDPRPELAAELGNQLMLNGYRLLTGGLGGIMEAASRGARQSAGWSEGRIIALLPHDSSAHANPWADIVIPSGLGLYRNAMIAHADAVIGVGGGCGTLSELAFAWQYKRLVICMQVAGWSGKLAGAPMDERIRFEHIPDDMVFAARTALDVIHLLQNKLPLYTSHYENTVTIDNNYRPPERL